MQWLIRLEPGQADRYYQKEASEKKKVGIFFALSLNPSNFLVGFFKTNLVAFVTLSLGLAE